MEEFLKIGTSILVLFISMVFTLMVYLYQTRKTYNRKVNKLLFNLLDIRSNLLQLKSFDSEFNEFINRFTRKYFPNQEDVHSASGNTIINSIGEIAKQNMPYLENMDQIIIEIDDRVLEISEIHPVLAYELKNKYNIKSKLKVIDDYLTDTKEKFGMYDSKFITDHYEPIILQSTIVGLDKHIREFSRKTNRENRKKVLKILNQKIEIDTKNMDDQIEKFMDKVNLMQGKPANSDMSLVANNGQMKSTS